MQDHGDGGLVAKSGTNLEIPWSPPGSSVHGISQAEILEWVAFPSPGDLHDPGMEPGSPALQVNSLLTGEPLQGRSLGWEVLFRSLAHF